MYTTFYSYTHIDMWTIADVSVRRRLVLLLLFIADNKQTLAHTHSPISTV